MPEKTSFRDSALRAVAIIGLIVILVLGAWGIIQIVVGLPDFFSTWGSGTPTTQTSSTEQVTLTAPAIVTSGQPFPLSWAHKGGSGNYSFSISYSCASDLVFAAPMPTGQYSQVPCNTPFNFTNATANVQLVAVLPDTATKQVNTVITVHSTRLSDNKVTATGTSTITVLPVRSTSGQSTTQKTTAPAPVTPSPKTAAPTSSTYTPSGRTSNLYGSPDLAVRILSAQPVNGSYSVQFVIENDGTNVAINGWEFNALLPLSPTYTYVSQPQQKLYPGDKIVYTLGFDMPQPNVSPVYPYTPPVQTGCGYTQNYTYNGYANYPTGPTYTCNNTVTTYPTYTTGGYQYSNSNNVFSVIVDPQNLIPEANKSNNSASASL